MAHNSKEDIIRLVEENDVEFIRLQFTDIFGILKNVAVPKSQLEKALNNQMMFDGSSIDGFARIEESDMCLRPDLDSFVIFPWRPQTGKVARLICDVYKTDGTPFEGDPRRILKKAVEEAAKLGYKFNVGPECEFFLFNVDENGVPTTDSLDRSGYFDLGPNDLGENARRDMVLTLEDMGFEIEEFGDRAYAVRAIPSNLPGIAKQDILMDLLDGLSDITGTASSETLLDKVASMSCKAAVKGNHQMSSMEAKALIDELLSLENPYNCPHGRPTIISMTKYEIEKKFRRIV